MLFIPKFIFILFFQIPFFSPRYIYLFYLFFGFSFFPIIIFWTLF